MEEQAQYKTATEMAAKRDKTWDECTDLEKMERLRREVRDMRDVFRFSNERTELALSIAVDHEHGNGGRVVTNPHRGGHAMVGMQAGRPHDPLA